MSRRRVYRLLGWLWLPVRVAFGIAGVLLMLCAACLGFPGAVLLAWSQRRHWKHFLGALFHRPAKGPMTVDLP